jgi:hypothetical protein
MHPIGINFMVQHEFNSFKLKEMHYLEPPAAFATKTQFFIEINPPTTCWQLMSITTLHPNIL